MSFSVADILIAARPSTVWDIITDKGNYVVWDSGITEVTGAIRNGATIRVRTSRGRRLRVKVEQIPGEVMTWTAGVPLGLLGFTRTFTVTAAGHQTHLSVSDRCRGPLLT